MHRVIVVGSPRADGRSAHVADELFNACIEECPEDGVSIVSVASISVKACRGCDACKPAGEPPEALPEDDDTLAIMPLVAASDAVRHRCVLHDDMTEVRKHLDAADELIVVSPVYFAGPPAQFKCLLDRLQPYYWSDVRTRGKRPCTLHVVGEGGDPYGFDPLVGCVQSAFGCAGFQLERLYDWVGKVSEDGEIVADADEYVFEAEGVGDWGELEPDAFERDGLGEEALFGRERPRAEDGRLGAKEREEVQRGRERLHLEETNMEPRRGSAEKGAASAPRAKLSLSEAKPQKGKNAQRDRREVRQAGGSGAQKQGSRKPKQGGKPQGGGSRQGSSARASGGSGSVRGSQKGKASYGKNAPGKGKGKRRG